MSPKELKEKWWVWILAMLSAGIGYRLQNSVDILVNVWSSDSSFWTMQETKKELVEALATISLLCVSLALSWWWFLWQKPKTLTYKFDKKTGFYFAGKNTDSPICTRCLIDRNVTVHLRENSQDYICTCCGQKYKLTGEHF